MQRIFVFKNSKLCASVAVLKDGKSFYSVAMTVTMAAVDTETMTLFMK